MREAREELGRVERAQAYATLKYYSTQSAGGTSVVAYPKVTRRMSRAALRRTLRDVGIRGGLNSVGWLAYMRNKRKSPEQIEAELQASIALEANPSEQGE